MKKIYSKDNTLPITLNFNGQLPVGHITLSDEVTQMPNLEEYVLTPSYSKFKDGTVKVIEYSLVHYTGLKIGRWYGDKVIQANEMETYYFEEEDL